MMSALKVQSVVVLIVMTIISQLLHRYGIPHERGFHCKDETITKPYHPIIIPMYYLLSIAAAVPSLAVVVTEYFHGSGRRAVSAKLKQFYFGLVLSFILVLLCKTYFGRLRPNSIDGICNARHYCADDPTRYVDQFVCDNGIPKLVREARMSFYSGHSSVAMYSAFYVILYLIYRFKYNTNSKTKSIVFTVQCIALILGLIPGFTQGINYWHHWSDIGTGYSVGALTAYLVINYV